MSVSSQVSVRWEEEIHSSSRGEGLVLYLIAVKVLLAYAVLYFR